jgi:phenylpyruvate tautomerase PptA (4-oxalocrotonate tautomerase family)
LTSDQQRNAIVEVIYDAMTSVLNVPPHDEFMVFTRHDDGDLIIDPSYLGIQRSHSAIIIQITLNAGRPVELKKSFYKAVAENIRSKANLRMEDVFINLVEVPKENWSFGNGVAQYAQPDSK